MKHLFLFFWTSGVWSSLVNSHPALLIKLPLVVKLKEKFNFPRNSAMPSRRPPLPFLETTELGSDHFVNVEASSDLRVCFFVFVFFLFM